ncbi:MAG: 50S ribosomal protein L11 methyltransferase, partial [Dechloromonas sp.]|nr:50S ribosomal protein L11 methyltransferase [Dechloromonas sp.]
MSWQNVSFLTDASHAEPMCDALLEAGALSASIEDADAGTPDEQPQFGEPGSINTPGWEHSRIVVLLEPDADAAAVLGEAARAIGLAATPAFSIEALAEQNWVQLTQSQFDP